MTELQKKWIAEGEEAILKIKNALDVIKHLKQKSALSKDFEMAIKYKNIEKEFSDKLLSMFEIRIK